MELTVRDHVTEMGGARAKLRDVHFAFAVKYGFLNAG